MTEGLLHLLGQFDRILGVDDGNLEHRSAKGLTKKGTGCGQIDVYAVLVDLVNPGLEYTGDAQLRVFGSTDQGGPVTRFQAKAFGDSTSQQYARPIGSERCDASLNDLVFQFRDHDMIFDS